MRIRSVESFRFIAVLFVVIIHAAPFSQAGFVSNEQYTQLAVFLNQIARFAVPFFFILSGYFFHQRVVKEHQSNAVKLGIQTSKRLLFLFVAWSIVYTLPINIMAFFGHGILGPIKESYWQLNKLMDNPLNTIFQGTRAHLWFFMSLIMCTLISSVFIKSDKLGTLMCIGILLYMFALLTKAYSDFGVKIDFNTRNGPFFGLLLFSTGIVLHKYGARLLSVKIGLVSFVFGTLGHFAELSYIEVTNDISDLPDFVISTYFMGLGAAILALSQHRYLSNERLSKLGKYSLGIYASHMLFVEMFWTFEVYLDNAFSAVLHVSAVTLLSIILVKVLSKFSFTKQLVQ